MNKTSYNTEDIQIISIMMLSYSIGTPLKYSTPASTLKLIFFYILIDRKTDFNYLILRDSINRFSL